MRVVIQTVSGSLRKEIEQYIQRIASNDIIDRYEVAWNAVKAHVRKTFLATNEEAYLRDEVETIEQSPYEPIASFNRRCLSRGYTERRPTAPVNKSICSWIGG